MKNKEYLKPRVRVFVLNNLQVLAGTTEEVPFDPEDPTDEALSKDGDNGSMWD